MVWQDYVITTANLVIISSLVNQVYYGFKNKTSSITLISSGIITLSLIAMGFSFFTLSLYFSAITIFISSTLWMTLFFQSIIYKKK